MTREQTLEETRAAILDQLLAVRADLDRHRQRVLREAGAVWLDLAIGYVQDARLDAVCITRRDGAHRTMAELDEALRRCMAEEFRLAEMLAEFDLRIALFAQGELSLASGTRPAAIARWRSASRAVRRWLPRLRPAIPTGAAAFPVGARRPLAAGQAAAT